MSASATRSTAPKPAWCIPAPCARNSARPRKRCFSPRATSTRIRRRPRRASRARIPATNIRASPIRPSQCSRSASRSSKARRPRAPPRPAWRRSPSRMMGQVRAGDHVVASKALFGSCLYVVEEYLPRYGVTSTIVDGTDLDQWRAAMRPNTKTVFMETPTNPTLEVIDIAEVSKIAHAAGATRGGRQRVLDAAVAKPAGTRRRLRRLFDHQAHRRPGPLPRRRHPRLSRSSSMTTSTCSSRQTGPSMSPFNAWVMLKGLETLAVRVRQQTEPRQGSQMRWPAIRRCRG